MDDYLRFVFFTGVTKFTKVSIFSDLNQLIDISLSNEYSSICGITEDELETNFQPETKVLADEQDMSYAECMDELKRMYDGYHFSKKGEGVYNPFSLLNAFTMKDFGSYWFGSGTPDILIKKLKASHLPLYQIADGVTATENRLQDYRVDNTDPVPLFYQTGYITICGYDRRFRQYTLRFPNAEVKYGFYDSLIPDILGVRNEDNPLSLEPQMVENSSR